MSCFALHGFLGLPSDLKDVSLDLITPNLFQESILPFWEWAESFNENVRHRNAPRTLVGYSMGGRLALHALLQNPNIWDSAILVSTHPGLISENERENRYQQDLKWAEKMRNDPWDTLLDDWNRQSALSTSVPIARHESEFDRLQLAKAMEIWSLGNQEDLRAMIAELEIPIRWVVGERDMKFCQLAKELCFKNIESKVVVVPKAGHRECLRSVKYYMDSQWLCCAIHHRAGGGAEKGLYISRPSDIRW